MQRRLRWGWVAFAALAAGAGAAGQASAQQAADSSAVVLSWSAPAGCPNAAHVEDEIAKLLAGGSTPEDRRIRASAEVTARAGKWRVEVALQQGAAAGERVVVAESCAAAADATALILALAVDPARVAANRPSAPASSSSAQVPSPQTATSAAPTAPPLASTTPPPPAPHPPPAPAPSPTPTPPPAPSRPPSRSSPTQPPASYGELALAAAVSIDSSSLPAPAPGIGAAFAWLPGRAPGEGLLRFELGAAYYPKQVTLSGPNPQHGGKFQLVAADAFGCLFVLRTPIELSPCLGAELAYMQGAGIGVSNPSATDAVYAGVVGRALVTFRLSRAFALRASVDGVVPIDRPEFAVSGFEAVVVHEPAALVARAALGAELRF